MYRKTVAAAVHLKLQQCSKLAFLHTAAVITSYLTIVTMATMGDILVATENDAVDYTSQNLPIPGHSTI